MVKFKTKTAFPIINDRNKQIGEAIIRLIVNDIAANGNGVTANGFYYYINEESEEIVLSAFKTDIPWQQVELAETQLSAFNPNSLRSAFIQRIIEFSFIQQQIESGDNYRTIYSDWELDSEFEANRKSTTKK